MISSAPGEILRPILLQYRGAARKDRRKLLCSGYSCCNHLSHHASWVSGNDCVGRYITSHDAAGADNGVFADGHTAQNRAAGSDRRALLDHRLHYTPVGFAVWRSVLVGSARIFVIDERHVVANENFILDRDALADECVARNFHVFADESVLLNFNKRAYPAALSDGASVQIDESMD